jgi:hypothetical protein
MIEYKDPLETLQQKGRGYLTSGKYPRIHVFSRSVVELDRLVRRFGGNYYKHRSGFMWVLSGKQVIADLIKTMDDEGYLPTVHGFENKVGG